MSQHSPTPAKNLESLLHRMTDRIRQSLELPEILEATADEMRRFLKTDRVKVYQFHEDGSGEVVAEAIKQERLPSLLGQRFPAEDIPVEAREMFLKVRQRSIVDVTRQEIGTSPLFAEETQDHLNASRRAVPPGALSFRSVDPCHVEYLTAMGVQSSLVVPIMHRHRLWGLLVAHHSVPKRFGNKELEIVQLIADQVGVAIAHASLLQLTRSQGQHESIINQIVSRLHSTAKDPLKRALAQMVSALQCVGGRLYIPASEPRTHPHTITVGRQPAKPPTLAEDKSPNLVDMEQLPSWRTWLKAEASHQIVANLWAISDIDRSAMSVTMAAALARSNIRGVLVAKLIHRNRFLGYLSLFREPVDTETIWAGRLDTTDARQQRPRQSFEAWREVKRDQAHPWSSQEIGLTQDLTDRFASLIYQTQLYQRIQALNADLEQRVLQRTAELQQINQDLELEIHRRERTLKDLQAAQDALKRLGHQNELILNSAGEGIYGIDPKGKIVFINPAAAKMLGYSKAKLIGQFIHDFLNHSKPDGSLYSQAQSPVFKTLKYSQTHHVTGDLFGRQDGSKFPVEYVSTSIQEQGKMIGAVVIFQDITERQAIELMKDEFIAVVSHELRTPLTSIRAALGLLAQSELKIPMPKRQRMVEIAFSNTNRLVRLVSDILDVERIKLGKITLNQKTCDLSVIMAQAADEMRAMADKHGIHLSVSRLCVQLYADPDRIIQTLTNLLSNAIKFSPPGSTVEVSAQQLESNDVSGIQHSLNSIGQQAIETGLAGAESLLLVSVKDRGQGMPGDKLEAIFAQFEQLNTSDATHQGGTGLGLAICRSIVQQHQGEIWAQSEMGMGSTVFFTLPVMANVKD
ncbi:MAG: ATP-binding protein [Phormidesmis sp.]